MTVSPMIKIAQYIAFHNISELDFMWLCSALSVGVLDISMVSVWVGCISKTCIQAHIPGYILLNSPNYMYRVYDTIYSKCPLLLILNVLYLLGRTGSTVAILYSTYAINCVYDTSSEHLSIKVLLNSPRP